MYSHYTPSLKNWAFYDALYRYDGGGSVLYRYGGSGCIFYRYDGGGSVLYRYDGDPEISDRSQCNRCIEHGYG